MPFLCFCVEGDDETLSQTQLLKEARSESALVLSEQITSSIHEIWRIARTRAEQLRSESSKVGLQQYWILRFLYESGPQRIKDIAKKIGTTSSPVTISVKRLESEKLVSRSRSKKDERVVTVSLTPRGRRTFEHLREQRRRDVSLFFDSLNDGEKRQLLNLLSKVVVQARTVSKLDSSPRTQSSLRLSTAK